MKVYQISYGHHENGNTNEWFLTKQEADKRHKELCNENMEYVLAIEKHLIKNSADLVAWLNAHLVYDNG